MICDFAETYGVFDYKRLPPQLAATLAVGLGIDSRIKRKLSGNKLPIEIGLLALIADGVNHLIWMLASNSGELQKPVSLFETLSGTTRTGDVVGFESGEEFMRKWRE